MATIAITRGYNDPSGFTSGETVTPAKLNSAQSPTAAITFVTADDTDDSTLEVSGGKFRVKDSGIVAAKLASNAVETAKINSGAVTAPKLQNGVTLQTVYSQTTSQTTVGSPYTIPLDNTKPQSSEGVEVLTASITPASATNKVLVEARLNGSTAGAATIVASLFRDSGADSISTVFVSSEGQAGTQISLTFQDSPSTTSATTYKIRAGYISTGSGYYINGGGDGSALFGGTVASWITLTEIKAS